MASIFISYRRDDSRGTAGRIRDALLRQFGRRRIFRDVDAIEAGADFVVAIEESIAAADVVLAVIGPDWLSISNEVGRRLEDPDDYVRRELELALELEDVRVIPVLVEGAGMPQSEELPHSIRELPRLNAITVRDERFDDDIDNLIGAIGGRPTVAASIRGNPGQAFVVGLGVLAAGAYLIAGIIRGDGLTPLTGGFNIAVSEFATTNDADMALAAGLSSAVSDQIQGIVEESATVSTEFAGPDEIGTVEGATRAGRAANAAGLAEELNADIVVYGVLASGDGASTLVVEFYLSGRNLSEAAELEGVYQVGAFEEAGGPAALEQSLLGRLEPKIRAVAQLMVGLTFYQRDEHELAEPAFLDAAEAWPTTGRDSAHMEVVYQLLGNAAGEQGPERLDDASGYYEQALEVNPDYPRALFGRAQIQFQRARGETCGLGSGPSDVAALEDAADLFRQVESLDPPPLSFLPVRSRLEVARILLCLTLNRMDRLESARQILDEIVAEHSDDGRLRNLLGEVHQSLATSHLISGDAELAIDEYRLAIESTLDEQREGLFHLAIGDVYSCFLARPDLAEAEYRASADLLDEPVEPSDCAATDS